MIRYGIYDPPASSGTAELAIPTFTNCPAFAAGETFGQHDAGVVARLHDHPAQQILDLDPRAQRHKHLRALGAPRALADRQLVLELGAALFQHVEDHIGGHHL